MRIIFLTHRLPYAPNRGDRLRAYHLLDSLRHWAQVHLVSLVHDREEEARKSEVGELATTVTIARVPTIRNWMEAIARLPTSVPLTHVLLNAPSIKPALARIVETHSPDLVLAYCSGMARFALEAPLAGTPFVLDMLDVDSEKWAALAASASWPKRWVFGREARLLRRFEKAATQRAAATLVVNERERASLAAIAPGARIRVVANGVDLERFRPHAPPAQDPRVVFCGVMDYRPNEEAAMWLAERIWPKVRAERPDARLTLVGSGPGSAIRAIPSGDSSIEVTGAVPDVRPYLWGSAVSVAPLQIARGIQNKVLEAIAAGLPCVVTPCVYEGLPADATAGCFIADTPEVFAEHIITLLNYSPETRRDIAQGAHLEALAWSRQLANVRPILESAARGYDPVRQRATR